MSLRRVAYCFWGLTSGVLTACIPDFNNPVDPQNPDAIPPTPRLEEVTLIPYEDLIVYRGSVAYTYRNALGILVERRVAPAGDFSVIDTLRPGQVEFADVVPVSDSAAYQYRLVAFNSNGFSGYSSVRDFSGRDTTDLFPPRLAIHYRGNPITLRRRVEDSVVLLRLQIWDESPIRSVSVNGRAIATPPAGSTWTEFTDTLRAFSTRYQFEVIDSSAQSRVRRDTLLLEYDYPNAIPRLEILGNESGRFLRWNSHPDLDFAGYALWLESTAGATASTDPDTVLTDVFDTVFRVAVSGSLQAFALALLDSAGNRIEGRNTRIELRDHMQYRNRMVRIPAGEFTDQSGKEISVTRSFYMDTTEVTQEHFAQVMGYNPSVFSGANNPVDAVSWFDAVRYCNARSRAEGLDTVYAYSSIDGAEIEGFAVRPVVGYRLPSEDEWELAARGGVQESPFPWGDDTTYSMVASQLWFSRNAGTERSPLNLPIALNPGTQRVAQKTPNAFGLYDMLGNVAEWTSGYWQSESQRSSPRTDNMGPETCSQDCQATPDEFLLSEDRRTIRGGSWMSPLLSATLSSREPQTQSLRNRTTGIRPILYEDVP